MNDLTLIYISASQMPARWREYQISTLLRSAGDMPIISVTRRPLGLGTNIIDNEEKSYWNIYRQLLRASRLAATPYVAMVEDDTLYPREHFTDFRPPDGHVSYNTNRWSLFAWDPIYCMRSGISNCSLIADRKYLIDALEERAAKYPNGATYVGEVGRHNVERRMGVSRRNRVDWMSTVALVQLNHLTGSDKGIIGGRRKVHGRVRALEIPRWGKSTDIVQNYRIDL